MRSLTKINLFIALAAGTLAWIKAPADILHRQLADDSTRVLVSKDSWQPENFKEGIGIPAAYAADAKIFLDGIDSEPAWGTAREVTVPLSFGSTESAQLKALYTDEDVIIRVRWPDATQDRLHHPWVWDEELGNYVQGPQVEDSIILSFEAGCEWFPSFLAGYDFDFDAWQWLAARTDPVGQALDLAGSVKDVQLPMNTKYPIRNKANEWNLRFTHRGDDILNNTWNELDRTYTIWPLKDTVYHHAWVDGSNGREFARQLQPPEQLPSSPAKILPRFEPIRLQGNAGEVLAKGHWEDGYWTVEFSRSRFSEGGTAYDIQFVRLTQFSLHIFDHVERLDQSSESPRLFLQFLEREPAVDVQLAGE
jgi:hypothetical protein